MNRREVLRAAGVISVGLGLRGGNKAFAQSPVEAIQSLFPTAR